MKADVIDEQVRFLDGSFSGYVCRIAGGHPHEGFVRVSVKGEKGELGVFSVARHHIVRVRVFKDLQPFTLVRLKSFQQLVDERIIKGVADQPGVYNATVWTHEQAWVHENMIDLFRDGCLSIVCSPIDVDRGLYRATFPNGHMIVIHQSWIEEVEESLEPGSSIYLAPILSGQTGLCREADTWIYRALPTHSSRPVTKALVPLFGANVPVRIETVILQSQSLLAVSGRWQGRTVAGMIHPCYIDIAKTLDHFGEVPKSRMGLVEYALEQGAPRKIRLF